MICHRQSMLALPQLLAASALLTAGCSGEYGTAQVAGRVTLNGQPVAKVAVMFQPVAPPGNINPGPGSYGITDDDGRYRLKIIGKETPGVVVGKHKVRFTVHEDPGDPTDDRPRKRPKSGLQIPARYYDFSGKMEYDVSARGTDAADFQLVSP